MPKYKVIKAHDGLPEGAERLLPVSSVTKYMVENGYWEEVVEPAQEQAETPAQPAKKRTPKPKK